MKLRRGLSGAALAHALEGLGYRIVRHTGSHLRPTTHERGGERHPITPAHDPLRAGTPSAIPDDVADYFALTRDEFFKRIRRPLQWHDLTERHSERTGEEGRCRCV